MLVTHDLIDPLSYKRRFIPHGQVWQDNVRENIILVESLNLLVMLDVTPHANEEDVVKCSGALLQQSSICL